jgi:predicted peptidase
MNRLLAALVLVLLLAGCTVSTPSDQPSQAAAPTASPSSASTPTPKPTPAPSLGPLPKGLVSYAAGSSDSPLPYLEYLPRGYDDGKPRPLLVFLHGVDEVANGTEASLRKILEHGIPQLIAEGRWPSERPFVVLMPQEPAAKSDRCDFAPEIDRFLDYALDRYEIDEARIYLTGISCGAIGVWDYMAATKGDRVAAAVPISGHPAWAIDKSGCAVAARTPLWVFQGARDDIIPIDWLKEKVAELRACATAPPKELELTIYPDADHDAWSRTYDLSAGHDIYAWLLKHKRS